MRFAIIAAGEGSRLAQEGVKLPKPLVKVNGKAMIDRLIDLFAANGATEIIIIVNNETQEVQEHVRFLQKKYPIRLVVQTTPSSMHSLYAISPYLRGDSFCLTTVDTIFRPNEFSKYIRSFLDGNVGGLMAVTDYIDDEKPLYISTNENLDIDGFYDTRPEHCKYISGGIYCLLPEALDILEDCIEKGMSRMRNFQRQLVTGGLKLKAYPFSKILDVDHAEDVFKAETFLKEKES